MHSATEPNPRLALARELSEAVLDRHRAVVHAIGVHGSLALGDDHDGSDVDFVVVTERPGQGPPASAARVRGIVVDFGVISAEEYLAFAGELSSRWPVDADQYLTTLPLYDPHGWHERLRQAHLALLARTPDAEFHARARGVLPGAIALADRARHLDAIGSHEAARHALDEAKVATALAIGFSTRRHFRGSWDAVERTGLAALDPEGLAARLARVVDESAARGLPVDAGTTDLAGRH